MLQTACSITVRESTRELEVKTIVLGGFTTGICVLFTMSDAYMRDPQAPSQQ